MNQNPTIPEQFSSFEACLYCDDPVENFEPGPRGGSSRNMTCQRCGARYNLAPIVGIAVASDGQVLGRGPLFLEVLAPPWSSRQEMTDDTLPTNTPRDGERLEGAALLRCWSEALEENPELSVTDIACLSGDNLPGDLAGLAAAWDELEAALRDARRQYGDCVDEFARAKTEWLDERTTARREIDKWQKAHGELADTVKPLERQIEEQAATIAEQERRLELLEREIPIRACGRRHVGLCPQEHGADVGAGLDCTHGEPRPDRAGCSPWP